MNWKAKKIFEFVIYGAAVPEGRPRVAKAGKFYRVYTPKKTREWKEYIALQSLEYRPDAPYECPIILQLGFYLPRPKSLPKKVVHHIKKPDIENLAKSILDALEGIFYKNDSQVVHLTIGKYYTTETPCVTVVGAGLFEEKEVDNGRRDKRRNHR